MRGPIKLVPHRIN
uniref:Uncharacterized protein n=1 Tax=Anguilla anguilla TaxID=7936 RepID=A0A0E9VKN7_ANGAN